MSQSLRQFETPTPGVTPKVWFSEAPEQEPSYPLVVFAAADDEPVIELEQFERNRPTRVGVETIGGFSSSLLLHAGLMLIMGLVVTVVQPPVQEIVWTDPIRATLADEEIVDLEPLAAKLEVQIPTPKPALERLSHFAERLTPAEFERTFSPDRFEPTMAAEEQDQTEHQILITPAEGKKFRYKNPGKGLAVTAGSFTVWTEPSDPLPRQPYLIVFEIRVPTKLETFPKSDLKIDVWGTDRFHLMIPDPRRNFALIGDLDVIDGKVQLVIPIPGAPALVRDLIQVESRKILRERQRLTITF